MKNIFKFVLLTASIGVSTIACAQDKISPKKGGNAQETKPFGFSMGMSEQQIIEALKARGADARRVSRYKISSKGAIAPLADYNTYEYLFTSDTGLCKVSAFSNEFDTEFGLKSEFAQLNVLLTKKYGKPSMDIVTDLRPYTGNSDFFTALNSGHYAMTANWGVDAKQMPDKSFKRFYIPLPSATVAAIRLGTRASPGGGQVELSFGFKNEEKCEAIFNNAREQAL